MVRTALGVIVASIVIYAWGFAYWGFGPYRTLIWKQAENDELAGQALTTHFTDRGTYFVPSFNADQQKTVELMEKGPVAMVHMLAPQGHPAFDPIVMGQGFVLNLVVVILVAVLLHNITPSMPTYLGRVGLVILAGLIASLLIDGGDIVWWRIPWEWKLYQAAYNVSVWVIAGAILAAFIRPPNTASAATPR
jgi:hypothetical protein